MALFLSLGAATQAVAQVYRCPGPPVLYTDALSAKEAQEKGCRTIEGTPITVVQAPKARAVASAASGARSADSKVDPAQQRARDSDRRRVLEAELQEAELRMAQLQKDYNGGQPERNGDERNYQRYLDRVADLKASIDRQDADIQAIKREISKLP
ncbi:MAG: hypothetical protein JOY60_12220 [Burkholderiaceae bacterium]|nr:hypothetical protein [Roseateles sp.]MBV8470610.1 hypothetical protein [Burkholderiaceae bacterium]